MRMLMMLLLVMLMMSLMMVIAENSATAHACGGGGSGQFAARPQSGVVALIGVGVAEHVGEFFVDADGDIVGLSVG